MSLSWIEQMNTMSLWLEDIPTLPICFLSTEHSNNNKKRSVLNKKRKIQNEDFLEQIKEQSDNLNETIEPIDSNQLIQNMLNEYTQNILLLKDLKEQYLKKLETTESLLQMAKFQRNSISSISLSKTNSNYNSSSEEDEEEDEESCQKKEQFSSDIEIDDENTSSVLLISEESTNDGLIIIKKKIKIEPDISQLPIQLPIDLVCFYSEVQIVFRLYWCDDVRASPPRSNTRGRICCFMELIKISDPNLQLLVGTFYSSFSRSVNTVCTAIRTDRVSAHGSNMLYVPMTYNVLNENGHSVSQKILVSVKYLKETVQKEEPNNHVFRNPDGSTDELLKQRNVYLKNSKQAYPEFLFKLCKKLRKRRFPCGQEMTKEQFLILKDKRIL